MWYRNGRRLASITGVIVVGAFAAPDAVPQSPAANATIVKPSARTVSGGRCPLGHKGTLGGVFGPSSLPPLAFAIGPRCARLRNASSRSLCPGSVNDCTRDAGP